MYYIDWSYNEIRLYIFEILYLVIFQLIIEIYKYISIYYIIHNINIILLHVYKFINLFNLIIQFISNL